MRPAEIETQLEGIRKAVAHSERLYHQGIFTLAELEGARTWALRQRFGPLMTTEEHVASGRVRAISNATESLMNNSRTPSAAAGEQAMRKAAAHYLADTHLNTQYASAEDQEKYAKKFHEEVKRFIDTSEFGDDADAALVEANVRMNLGETVEKPRAPTTRNTISTKCPTTTRTLAISTTVKQKRRGPTNGTSITTAPVTRATLAPARSRRPATSSRSTTNRPNVTTTEASRSIGNEA